MAIADHTFSFRAPAALAERLRTARRTYVDLAADPSLAAHISRELEITLQRSLRENHERLDSQGRIMRAVVEAFVTATEAAARDELLADEMRAFDREDRAGPEERAALLNASTARVDE